MKRTPFFILAVTFLLLMACCGQSSVKSEASINPRDTVNVPEWLTGEDSIAYIENAILHSPISAEDLLGLAEVHSVEDRVYNYNNFDKAKESPQYANFYLATHRDSAAMRLANRFMRMANLVNINGNANDKLQWAVAVNAALDSFRVAVPSVPSDSTLYEIVRVVDSYSSLTQSEMNFQCYVSATVDYYRTIESYRKWLLAVPANLKPLMQKEYETWHDLNEARFAFQYDVSYRQGWYSMTPMEIEGCYEHLSKNRRAELGIERGIILAGKPYHRKGTIVTTKQWEQWLANLSASEDLVNNLRSCFSHWLAARQAIASALPKEQGKYYDNITADIHCRLIDKLADLIPYEGW